MNDFRDRVDALQMQLRKTRKLHNVQVDIIKQKLSAVNFDLQALQISLGCELVEAQELLVQLNRIERQLPKTEPIGSNEELAEPQFLS